MRPTLKEYYLGIARAVAVRSPCPPGKQHGAVIVVSGRVVATGYNGPPTGWDHCLVTEEGDCPLDVAKAEGRKNWEACQAVHAEVNAVVTAALAGTSVKGGTLYVTKRPCEPCMRVLANCALEDIVYEGGPT